MAALGVRTLRRARRPHRPAAPRASAEHWPRLPTSTSSPLLTPAEGPPGAARARAASRRTTASRAPSTTSCIAAAGRALARRRAGRARARRTQHRPHASARCSRARSRAATPTACRTARSTCVLRRHRRPELRRLGARGTHARPRRARRNDYVGKGLSGGAHHRAPAGRRAATCPSDNVVVGNIALYGATGGRGLLPRARRRALRVRNSGASAVVEGVGDHGCEYMTGGVVVDARADRAATSPPACRGGIAYVLDPDGRRSRTREPRDGRLEPRRATTWRCCATSSSATRALTGSERRRAALLTDWDAALRELRQGACRTTCAACCAEHAERDAGWRWPVTDPRGFLRAAPAPAAATGPRRGAPAATTATCSSRTAETATCASRRSRCMDCGVPFCHTGCPLGNLIPDWNDLVHRGDWREAIERLHSTNNFPEFTGKLCPAPCEEACVLTLNDDAVTIKEIEWAIVDRAWHEGWIVPRRAAGARPAAASASSAPGPAGLAAAQQLARAGHAVTVYERDDRAGGLLRYGIPDFKLDKDARRPPRSSSSSAEGVDFADGVAIGRDVPVDELRAPASTRSCSRPARSATATSTLPGADLAGVAGGHALPRAAEPPRRRPAGRRPDAITAAGQRVVVLGGGDTSADCLGNALREGAASVHEIAHGPTPPRERTPLRTWPDWPSCCASTAPTRRAASASGSSRRSGSRATTAASSGCARGASRSPASPRPASARGRPVDGGEVTLDVDLVLLAIGFTGVETDDPARTATSAWSSARARPCPWTRASRTAADGVWAARRLRARRRPDRARRSPTAARPRARSTSRSRARRASPRAPPPDGVRVRSRRSPPGAPPWIPQSCS